MQQPSTETAHQDGLSFADTLLNYKPEVALELVDMSDSPDTTGDAVIEMLA